MLTALKRNPMKTALTLSVLFHLSLLWDGEFELPDILNPDSQDEVLARKKAESIPKVRLQIKPSARPQAQVGVAVVTLLNDSAPPTAAPSANKTAKKQSAKKAKEHHKAPVPPSQGETVASTTQPEALTAPAEIPPEPTSEAVIPLSEATPPPTAPVVATPVPDPTPKNEPPPPFPIAIDARYKASFMGFSVELKQEWHMEGNRYSIENSASKFGFKALISSEGAVTTEGLSPDQYRFYLNSKLKSLANFDRNSQIVQYGKPTDLKQSPITADIQDAASLPFQVAVGFNGTEVRQMQVTTGNSVYTIELKLLSEEMLKLPAGVIRTLHLQGQRTHTTNGNVQQGYDVWLAPDYRNFPVKFRGPTNKGEVMELSLKSLEFEGQKVLGKNLSNDPDPEEPSALPQDLLQNSDVPANGD